MECKVKDSNGLFMILSVVRSVLNRIKNALGLAFLFLSLIGAGPSGLKSQTNETDPPIPAAKQIIGPETLPIASVNGREISMGRFNKLYKDRVNALLSRQKVKISPLVALRTKINIASELIDEALLEDQARSQGIFITDHEINREVQQFAATFPNKKKFQKYLSTLPGGLERLSEITRFRMLKERLAGVEEPETVSDEEAKRFYDQHKYLFHVPAHLVVQEIIFYVQENDPQAKDKAQREKAERILREARKPGSSFSLLARRYSEGVSSKVGGYMRPVTQDSIEPALWNILARMKTKAISDVIRASNGYHILKLVGRNPELRKDYPEVKADIKKSIQLGRYSSKIAELISNLRREATIENHLAVRYRNLLQPFISADQKATISGSFRKDEQLSPPAGVQFDAGKKSHAIPGKN